MVWYLSWPQLFSRGFKSWLLPPSSACGQENQTPLPLHVSVACSSVTSSSFSHQRHLKPWLYFWIFLRKAIFFYAFFSSVQIPGDTSQDIFMVISTALLWKHESQPNNAAQIKFNKWLTGNLASLQAFPCSTHGLLDSKQIN